MMLFLKSNLCIAMTGNTGSNNALVNLKKNVNTYLPLNGRRHRAHQKQAKQQINIIQHILAFYRKISYKEIASNT